MSRELKFRQWLSDTRRFHYFEFKNGMCEGVASASLDINPIDQFTGFYDKNGVEICEGDIVEWVGTNEISGKEMTCRAMVIFKNQRWYPYLSDVMTIIGTSHENSELLGGK